jgi:hypothetical protein
MSPVPCRARSGSAGTWPEARLCRRARGPADRREAIPGDVLPATRQSQDRSRATAMSLLPVELACRLADRTEDQRWLVTSLWSEQAGGIIGGEPKCCKSFLALDLPGPRRRGGGWGPVPESLRRATRWAGSALRRRGCAPCGSPLARRQRGAAKPSLGHLEK